MCDICSILKRDKPFRFHRTDEFTSPVLVGKKANKYLKEFENNIFPSATKGGPCFSAVIGEPGSGKTHFLYHLRHESQWRPDISCVIYELKDKEIDLEILEGYIENTISSSEKKEGATLCLLVDTVDEYLRNIRRKHNSTENDAIIDFLTVFSKFVDANPGSCVVFAITRDVYNTFKQVLNTSVFKDKFIFVKDGTEDLILDKMDEKETYEMVSNFLGNWKKRNNIKHKKSKECSINGFDLFPFTPEAVKLFWKASVVPGDTSLGCTLAINDKLKEDGTNNERKHLIITEGKAAWTIIHFSSYFRGYGNEAELKSKVQNLVESERVLQSIEKIGLKAKQQQFDYLGSLLEAFEYGIQSLDSNFSSEIGNKHKFVKDKYDIDAAFKSIDLVLTYQSKKIGVQFISCNGKNIRRSILDSTSALDEGLRNNEISNGIIFLIYDKIENLQDTMDKLEKIWHDSRKKEDFLPDGSHVNYRGMLVLEDFSIDVAWQIVGIFEEFGNMTDTLEVKSYFDQINLQNGLVNAFKTAFNKSPDRALLHVQSPSLQLLEK